MLKDFILFFKALFINGKVSPATEGVRITVTNSETGEVVAELLTDAQGGYKAGPLDSAHEYRIGAAKQGYTITEVADQVGEFFCYINNR